MLTFASHVTFQDTKSAKAEKQFLVVSVWKDGVVEVCWWHDRTFHQSVHLQARVLICTRVADMKGRVAYGKLEILAYVRV
jgi:hypothetical protein